MLKARVIKISDLSFLLEVDNHHAEPSPGFSSAKQNDMA